MQGKDSEMIQLQMSAADMLAEDTYRESLTTRKRLAQMRNHIPNENLGYVI